MSEIVKIEVQADVDAAESNLAKVNSELRITNEESNKTTESVSNMSEELDDMTGGAISKFKTFKESVLKVSKGFVTLKGAIIGTGIGALAILIGSVVQAFKKSEAGQDKFAKLMGIIGSVVNNVTDQLAILGEKIIENPFELLLIPLRSLFKRLEGVLLLIPNLAKALNEVFKGNFKEAGTIASDAFLQIATGVENASEKIKEFGKELEKDAIIAGRIADLRAKATKAERELIVSRAEADRTRADLLEKAIDREKFTIQERIKFLEEAGQLEDKITQDEINAARLRLEAKIAENEIDQSSIEDLNEQAELEARLIELETAKLNKQREVTSQVIALRTEEAAALKTIKDQEAQEEIDRIKKIEEETQKLFDEKVKRDLTALKKKRDDEKKQKQINDAKEKVAIAQDNATLGRVTALAGAGSAVGKAAAVAQATISGIEGVQNAYTTAQSSPITVGFPAYPIVQAGLAAAFSAKQIQSILAIQTPAGASAGGYSRGSANFTPSPSAAPAFNVVGQSSESQLAQTIGQNDQKPIKAFVVSSDVSNAQALDRNIIESASIG